MRKQKIILKNTACKRNESVTINSITMKAVLPCRVSTKEQEESGYSLPAQEKFLRAYTENKGHEVEKIFHISESASGKKQREIFNAVFDYVKKHDIKIIIVEKADRFTRNFKDSVDLWNWLDEDETRQLHSVKDSLILHKNSRSQEKLNWDIRIVFAKNYIDNLSEEVKKGQKEKIAQGWLPTKPPIGYKTVGEKGHKIHIIDETKAPFIRRMFELYATGEYSIKKLTEMMYQEGLRNANGHRIAKSRIHEYLSDPFYIGKIRWNDVKYEGKHEPLISESLFDVVQRTLKGKTTPKSTRHNFLFKALIRCVGCGGLITWEIAKKKHIYGHCNHYRDCSQEVWVKERDVEKQLLKYFTKLEIRSPRLAEWLKKALKESHKDEIAFHSSSVGEVNKQHDLIKQRLDKLYDEKLDGKITEEFYNRKFKQYSDELKAADKALVKHSEASIKYFELGINFYTLSQKATAIYQKALLDQKRMLIRLVFENLTLNEGALIIKYTKAFQILHDAVQYTNGSKVLKNEEKVDKIFEPAKKVDITGQTGDFGAYRPVLLPRLDSNQ